MGSVISEVGGASIDRRTFIKRGAAGAALVGTAIALPSMTGTARASGAHSMHIHVRAATFTDMDGGTSPGSFVVVGNITRVDGTTVVGKYLCRGTQWFLGSFSGPDSGVGAFVSHRFQINDMGTLLGEGVEGDAALGGVDEMVVIGGTGAFAGASGKYAATGSGPRPFGGGSLRFHFDLV